MSQLRNSTLVSEGEKAESNPDLIPQLSRPSPPIQTAMLAESGNSEGSVIGYATVEEQRGAIEAELRGYEFEDETLERRAFRNIAQSEEAVKAFIAGCDLYDKKNERWLLPEKPSEEKTLYGPLAAIIEAISAHFHLNKQRTVLRVHNTKITHVEGSDSASQYPDAPKKKESSGGSGSDDSDDSDDSDFTPSDNDPSESKPALKSSPDICIQAVVPNKKMQSNFPYIESSHRNSPSYRQTVSAIEVKTEKNFEPKPNRTQVAVYARFVSALYF